MMKHTLATTLARYIQARKNCEASGNTEWFDIWTERITKLCEKHMPHGSGLDVGCELDLPACTARKLVIVTSYHHMNEAGFYTGWTDHKINVTASLTSGFEVTVTGKNKNDVKEWLATLFTEILGMMIDEDEEV